MHVPSSPPLLATYSRKRKVHSSNDALCLSSDPPIFSSDPPDASIDCDRNRKRLYRGHWWSHLGAAASKSDLERNYDSGVFMASDDSLPAFDAHIAALGDNIQHPFAAVAPPTTKPHSCDSPAQSIVNRALEHGDQVIDLSNLKMTSLSNDVPLALLSLVNAPRFELGGRAPDEQEYQSLISSIQLFLANNLLQSLPPSLWRLQNLTVLSLRNNRLKRLPSGIAELRNLQELNVANNCLRWLPWELLRLLGPDKPLKKLHVRPNPLFTGIPSSVKLDKLEVPTSMAKYKTRLSQLSDALKSQTSDTMAASPEWWVHELLLGLLRSMEAIAGDALRRLGPACLWTCEEVDCTHHCFPVAVSDVCYLEKDGSSASHAGTLMPSMLNETTNLVPRQNLPKAPRMECCPIVPSLLELTMRQCAVSIDVDKTDISRLFFDEAPITVIKAVEQTYEALSEGQRICTTCSRQYIIPRTEWIEYWHCIPKNASTISTDEMFWPFLRRGCSWACDN